MWPPLDGKVVVAAIVTAAAAVGCRDRASMSADAGLPASASASTSAPASARAESDAGSDAGADAEREAEESFLAGQPARAKAIGHTSVALKVELTTGKKGVFKPASRRGPARYKGEVAAYRLGTALEIPNVPRAYFRTFAQAALGAATGGPETPGGALFAKEAIVDKDGSVRGALMPWIDGLDFLPLEKEPWWTRWRTWLRRGETIPDDQKDLARQASNLVLFDFLSGNWDRWSGGNVGWNKERGMLLYIDNDGAFFEVPPKDGLERNAKLLREIDRFSKSFVAGIRALDGAALAKAFGEESEGVPLLSAKALAGVAARREALLAIIDEKAAGAGDVFAFP